MQKPFPDSWWPRDITSLAVHRFAFDVDKRVVTAALIGRYTFGVEEEWQDYAAPVSDATVAQLGVDADDAFIFSQVIYPISLAFIHQDAGKKLNRAESALQAAVRDLDALDAAGVRRAVRIFLSAYADARAGTLAHYLEALKTEHVPMAQSVECWERGVPLSVATDVLPRFGRHTSAVLSLEEHGVDNNYAMSLLYKEISLESIADFWDRKIPLEYALSLLDAGASPEQIVDLWSQDIALEFALATMG